MESHYNIIVYRMHLRIKQVFISHIGDLVTEIPN